MKTQIVHFNTLYTDKKYTMVTEVPTADALKAASMLFFSNPEREDIVLSFRCGIARLHPNEQYNKKIGVIKANENRTLEKFIIRKVMADVDWSTVYVRHYKYEFYFSLVWNKRNNDVRIHQISLTAAQLLGLK